MSGPNYHAKLVIHTWQFQSFCLLKSDSNMICYKLWNYENPKINLIFLKRIFGLNLNLCLAHFIKHQRWNSDDIGCFFLILDRICVFGWLQQWWNTSFRYLGLLRGYLLVGKNCTKTSDHNIQGGQDGLALF